MIHNIIKEMIKLNGNDTRRINHALKVYAFAKCIIESETDDEKLIQIVGLSAILHDIGIKKCEEKYNSCAGNYQEIEGPPIAKEILLKYYEENDIIERVLFLIAHHHTYSNIDGLDYQVLIEADFLVNLDEEKSSKEAILGARKNLFKTDMGINLLDTMLLN